MDLKKAKLDDDAFIYTKKEYKTGRARWKELHGKEKWTYFKDYYLLRVLILTVVAIILGKLLWDTFGPKPTEVLNVAIDSYSYLIQDFEAMQEPLLSYMGLDSKEYSVRLDTNYAIENDPNAVQRLSIYIMTGDVDVLIATEKVFTQYIEKGALAPLTTVLPDDLLEKRSDKLYKGQIIERELDETIISVSDEDVYGILLDDLPVFNQFVTREDRPIFGIIDSSPDKENAVKFLRFLLENQN